jgi:hypothetical protein
MFARARRSRRRFLGRLDVYKSTATWDPVIGKNWMSPKGVWMMLVEVFGWHVVLFGCLDGPMSGLIAFWAMASEGCLEHDMIGMGCMVVVVVMIRMLSSPWDMHVGAPVGFGITFMSSGRLTRLWCLSMMLGRVLVRIW